MLRNMKMARKKAKSINYSDLVDRITNPSIRLSFQFSCSDLFQANAGSLRRTKLEWEDTEDLQRVSSSCMDKLKSMAPFNNMPELAQWFAEGMEFGFKYGTLLTHIDNRVITSNEGNFGRSIMRAILDEDFTHHLGFYLEKKPPRLQDVLQPVPKNVAMIVHKYVCASVVNLGFTTKEVMRKVKNHFTECCHRHKTAQMKIAFDAAQESQEDI